MSSTNNIWIELARPFPADKIRWRIGQVVDGRCKPLAYMDARDVYGRLDETVGPDHWQTDLRAGPEGRVFAGVGIQSPEDLSWIWKWDGAGETQIEGAKGAISDAIKRAASQHGIGRFLYKLDAPWVAVESIGRRKILSPKVKEWLADYAEAALSGKKAPSTPSGGSGSPQKAVRQPERPARQEADRTSGTPEPPAPRKSQTKRSDTPSMKFIFKKGFEAAEEAEMTQWCCVNDVAKRLGVKRIQDVNGDEDAMQRALVEIENWRQSKIGKTSQSDDSEEVDPESVIDDLDVAEQSSDVFDSDGDMEF